MKKIHDFRVVTFFNDGIALTHPDMVNSKNFCKIFFDHVYNLLFLSDKIFCVSDFARRTLDGLIAEHNISATPIIKTIHEGDNICHIPDIVRNTQPRPIKNILYVSTIEARKNHLLLLRVWKKLIEKNKEKTPKLILVGMRGWGVEEFYQEYEKDKSLQQFVDIRSNVSDAELSKLYLNASFCVFPSFVEGWGLGAVESLRYGKVCLISDCEALKEATQALMPALPATDVDQWTNVISEFIDYPQKIKALEHVIDKYFKRRSWNDFSVDVTSFVREW